MFLTLRCHISLCSVRARYLTHPLYSHCFLTQLNKGNSLVRASISSRRVRKVMLWAHGQVCAQKLLEGLHTLSYFSLCGEWPFFLQSQIHKSISNSCYFCARRCFSRRMTGGFREHAQKLQSRKIHPATCASTFSTTCRTDILAKPARALQDRMVDQPALLQQAVTSLHHRPVSFEVAGCPNVAGTQRRWKVKSQ